MPPIRQTTGGFIDAIRINKIVRTQRAGRLFWVKYRRGWARALAHCANGFFRAAGNPVIVWADLDTWQRWEVDSFHLLHGAEGYQAFAEGERAVWAEHLPGMGLEETASRGELTEAMLEAVARELRRAHSLPSLARDGLWSHGDPHLGNFLFDADTGRARLIDFEVAHRAGLPEVERHSDDLLVFLQDLMGRSGADNWLPAATCFLHHYRQQAGAPGCGKVLAALQARLESPRKLNRIWWAIRTSYLPQRERTRRIAALREALASPRFQPAAS